MQTETIKQSTKGTIGAMASALWQEMDLSVDVLKQLYYQMLRIRMVDEKIVELYPEQEMRCPVHLSIGQEAVAVGACAALSNEDHVFSTHRAHAHYLAKGGDLKAMLAEIYLKETGCCQGKGGSMHLIDRSVGFLGAAPIVGSTVPMTVGSALASAIRGESRVAMAFFGEATTEEGVFHESVNLAMLKKLPVIFVCENNLYSVYSPLSVRQPAEREAYELVRGHGIESLHGDGNNVIEVYEMVRNAVNKARQGGGPTFLEFATYRWREHCGPNYDNHLGYRTEAEFLEWKARDPIKRMYNYLLENDICDEQVFENMVSELDEEIAAAFKFAQESPYPRQEIMFERIYA
jgi:pyruvate dehydrogenase E1 component alpha subunit